MNTNKLQLLIDNKLTCEERTELIDNIKTDAHFKQELAILMKIKQIGKQKIRTVMAANKKNSKPTAIAKFSLAEIRRAAFGQNKSYDELTSLPIKDETLDDFLNDED